MCSPLNEDGWKEIVFRKVYVLALVLHKLNTIHQSHKISSRVKTAINDKTHVCKEDKTTHDSVIEVRKCAKL